MLSYLKDANQTPASSQMEGGLPPAAEGTGSSQVQEYLKPASHAKNVKQGTIILVILFLAGAAGVWWMIKKSGLAEVKGAAEETTQIDQALAQLTSFQTMMNDQMDTVSGRFFQASELGQITVADLKKNPFRQEWAVEQAAEDLSASQSLLRKEEMQRRAAQLKLWSITEREQNSCCMIQDKVLYVGDTIHGFTVQEIHPDRVVLVYDDLTVELKMQ